MPSLSTLHDEINAIAPIHGISDNGDNTYRIDWIDDPTTEQQAAADEAIALWQSEPELDWKGLLDDLQGSAVFARGYAASNESIPALNAFNMTIATLTGTQRIDNITFAFSQLVAAMPSTTAGAFTLEELTWLRDRLLERGFPVEQFGL